MDDTKQVELICDCHKKVGFVLLTKEFGYKSYLTLTTQFTYLMLISTL